MISAIRMHLQGIKTALAVRMAYRADFFISAFIMLISEFFGPLLTYLIYSNESSIPGWSMYEVVAHSGNIPSGKGYFFPFLLWHGVERTGKSPERNIRPYSHKTQSQCFSLLL